MINFLLQDKLLKKETLLVQLVERRFPKPDVVGSSPTGRARHQHPTFNKNWLRSPHRLEA